MDPLSKAMAKARASRGALSQADQGEGVGDRGLEYPAKLPVELRIQPVQRHHLEANRILTDSGNLAALAAFKQLRTQIVQRMGANGWHTLVVTSPREGNGKTVTAINLAVNLARQNHPHVLLADLDLRQPRVQQYLSTETVPGISDYILNETPIGEILFNPGIEGLTVLPGREAFSHSSEALLLRKTVDLITALKNQYADGFLVMDMPPVLATDDVLAFSNHWDAALLVVEEGSTTEPDLRRALDMLSVKPLLGTVLTKSQSALPSDVY